jgi:DMSO/TMAO reductase YedYZ molybdopterin-dependent catalytic subunit
MRQPEVTVAASPGPGRRLGGEAERRLPPGQHVQPSLPILHYGPVPGCDAAAWDLAVTGATASGAEYRWNWDEFRSLPCRDVVADFHCVTRFSVLGITWSGVPAAEVLRAVPPADAATHVMVCADFGYAANLPLDVFGAGDTLFAVARQGRELSRDQGYPVRLVVPSRYGWKSVKWVRAIEYMVGDRRGFWEERGYHNNADPWREQRYSYQEQPGEGPALLSARSLARERAHLDHDRGALRLVALRVVVADRLAELEEVIDGHPEPGLA